mmetsp:Transcript_145126/g.404371  ORF Transcript_145126/g.404371 Transcript_145126/m.404371 type:complete len:232 (-) Transcript_145126:160-855(-)
MQSSWKRCPQGKRCTARRPFESRSWHTAQSTPRASPSPSGRAAGNAAMRASTTAVQASQEEPTRLPPRSSAGPAAAALALAPARAAGLTATPPAAEANVGPAMAGSSDDDRGGERAPRPPQKDQPRAAASGCTQGATRCNALRVATGAEVRSASATSERCRGQTAGLKATRERGSGGKPAAARQRGVAWTQSDARQPTRLKPRQSSAARRGRSHWAHRDSTPFGSLAPSCT